MSLAAMELALRKMLAELARSSKTRFVGQPPVRPNNWKPDEVVDVEGNSMTDLAAWALIADRLSDEDQTLEQMTLDTPVGARAYVMKFALPHLQGVRVYVKFECLKPNSGMKICGRSFHLENPR